ncbi:Hsp70 family protein [Dactylosporangium sp. AC04546]|uniref:Hsp70 family protein n=1 Tax=Dactylosporangium sp. AC04546 TaxID=2862460 RepID=UPI001EE07CE7|nr:Hsp70 family protein [Dactylosporangium sp. AC04546]WVK86611.1 Hsp70 family protein [Dactylosporangium sp. AC04546]
MDEPVLVIDFGTSTSSAVLVADGAARPLKEPGSGSYSWPSVVCRDGERLLVGVTAERRKRSDPAAYRAEFKRDLGQVAEIPLGDASYPVEHLVAAVLRVLRDRAEELHGAPVDRAVLTVPASYGDGDARRNLMVAAGERAGFAEVDLLPEPVAAALAPLPGAGFGAGDLVLVYDFGGGTFDAALVRFGPDGGHDVLGHRALDDCGGRDVDAVLIDHIRTAGGDGLAESLHDGGSRMVRLRFGLQLGDFARGVKHQLSEVDAVEDFVTAAAPPSHVARAELATLIAPLLARTIDCCHTLLRGCGVAPGNVAAVLLVGGTSRMPVVADTVGPAFDRLLRRPEDPDLAVAQGAAELELRLPPRRVEPEVGTDITAPRWTLPGGGGRLVRVLAGPGDDFAPGDVLAVARDVTGRLQRLLAPPFPGRVEAWTVAVGEPFASTDAPARVARTGSALRLLDPPRLRFRHDIFKEKVFDVKSVAFSADGRKLVFAHQLCSAWTYEAGTGYRLETNRWSAGDNLDDADVSPDGRWLATAAKDGFVYLWDTTINRPRKLRHGARVSSVHFSDDGRSLVSSGWSSTVRVWDVTTAGCSLQFDAAPSYVLVGVVRFGPGGRVIATGTRDATALWDTATGQQLVAIPHDAHVLGLAFAPDGRRLAASYDDGTVIVWDTATGAPVLTLGERQTGTMRDRVTGVAFSPDGCWVAAGHRGAVIWDAVTGERLGQAGGPDRVRAVAFSPDGLALACGGHQSLEVHEIAVPR